MVQKMMEFDGLEGLQSHGVYQELVHGTTDFDDELCEFERLLEESNKVDLEYKTFLLYILKAKSQKKQREKDVEHDNSCYHVEENDPQYDIFFESLKEYEKSYIVEYEKNGAPVVIRYEEESCSDQECEQEPRRKLRSAMKQGNGSHNQTEKLARRQLRNKHGPPAAIRYEKDPCSDKEHEPEPRIKLRSAMIRGIGPPNQMPSADNGTEKLAQRQSRNKHGPPVVSRCAEDSSSNNECEPKPRRSLRNSMKRGNRLPNPMPSADNEIKKLAWRQSRNKSENEQDENIKFSIDKTGMDPDYLTFSEALEFVDDYFVYKHGGHAIVYEHKAGENNQEEEENDDGCSSDVEILESSLFYEQGNPSFDEMYKGNMSMLNLTYTTSQSEFRRNIIAVLRKPYDEEEYDKLWQDIELRLPKVRHRELCNGREMSYKTTEKGKSHLDNYPDFERKLLLAQDNKPKCLNLLRGFFFWLQRLMCPDSFKPWQDAECLAIKPKSR